MVLRWLSAEAVIAFHDEQIAEHGGLPGLRDSGLLESALNRPRNLHHYGCDDLIALAAAYAAGIVQDHPFLDGNKRASLVSTTVFLALNGWEPTFSEAEAIELWLALAAGQIGETQIAEFIRANTAAIG